MKILLWINRVLLTWLSTATGAVKLAQMEAEICILREIGLSDGATIGLGVLQVIGGLLILVGKTTRLGAWIMAPTLVFATVVLLVNGMVVFGCVSVLFIAMSLLHALRWPR